MTELHAGDRVMIVRANGDREEGLIGGSPLPFLVGRCFYRVLRKTPLMMPVKYKRGRGYHTDYLPVDEFGIYHRSQITLLEAAE